MQSLCFGNIIVSYLRIAAVHLGSLLSECDFFFHLSSTEWRTTLSLESLLWHVLPRGERSEVAPSYKVSECLCGPCFLSFAPWRPRLEVWLSSFSSSDAFCTSTVHMQILTQNRHTKYTLWHTQPIRHTTKQPTPHTQTQSYRKRTHKHTDVKCTTKIAE